MKMNASLNSSLLQRTIDLQYENKKRSYSIKWSMINGFLFVIFVYDLVNAVLPGFTETPIVNTVPEKVAQQMIKMIPLGRMGKPSEIAEVITFLSSEKSSFVTGAAVDVTGGF